MSHICNQSWEHRNPLKQKNGYQDKEEGKEVSISKAFRNEWNGKVSLKTSGNPELSRWNNCVIVLQRFHFLTEHRGWTKEERRAVWGGWRETRNVNALMDYWWECWTRCWGTRKTKFHSCILPRASSTAHTWIIILRKDNELCFH